MKTWTDSGNKTIFRNLWTSLNFIFGWTFLNFYELYSECFELHNYGQNGHWLAIATQYQAYNSLPLLKFHRQ